MQEVTVGVAPNVPALGPWLYGLEIAAGWKSKLRAVMVNDSFNRGAPIFAHGDILADWLERVRSLWKEEADETDRRIQEQAKARHVKLDVVRREGRLVDVLLEAGKASQLIVVGRGGSSDHPGSFGSRGEILVRRCPTALLVTPLQYRKPRRVVAAYAAKSLGGRVLDLGFELARALDIGLIVLTVGGDHERIREIQRLARERLSDRSSNVEYVGVLGEPDEVIPAKVGVEDLLVLGPHGRSPLYRMLLGRVTDRVIRAVHGPIALTARE